MPEEIKEQQQQKRSKRHRMNRNKISDKARIDAVREFGIYSREVEKKYRSRYPKKEAFDYFQ